jgi:hypothetical protein
LSINIESDLPENHGLSSKHLLQFFTQIEQSSLGINSFMLLQDGKATASFWRKPYRNDCQQLLFSLSKSFTSIAAGIAWDSGYFDLHDKVISFFPNKLPDSISLHLANMTIHHLLSMNTGHHDNIYGLVAKEHDWVKAFLSLDVQHEPGSFYRYSTHATYMLSAIIEKVTGQNLVDFLMPRLFGPLGIARPTWETCPMGITAGGMGLSLTTEGIARFGQMLLDRGMYNGQRIVSEQYIDLAAREQSDNRRDEERIDFAQGYGYQFFLCRHGCFMGTGGFGQVCFVAPKENIVIAATSSFQSMKQLQALLDLIYKHIIEPLDKDSSSHCHPDYDLLPQRLAAMAYPVPTPRPIPNDVPDLDDCCYILDENPHYIRKLSLTCRDESLELQLFYEDRENSLLLFDFTKPVHTRDIYTKDLSLHQQEVVTYAFWQDKHTLKLTLLYIETPYEVTYTITFNHQSIGFQFHMNVSLHTKEYKVSGTLDERI